MNLSERLTAVLRETGIDQVELAKAMTVTKGAVNQILNGGIQSLKLEYAVGIQERFGYNAVWLVLGKGPKKGSASPEEDINSSIREGKPALSGEAEQLIACVTRLDGINKHAPEIFGHIFHILALAHKGALTDNASTVTDLIRESEAVEVQLNHRSREPSAEHAARKKATRTG